MLADRLQHDRRADHVDPGAEDRVGTDERHLEGGEVDDVGDAVVDHSPLEGALVRDVAGDDVDVGELFWPHDQVRRAGSPGRS
jgi:hypothetical protein